MAFEYDPITSLRHWPTPMSRFGKTPYGDNLYRIVFRDSRRHLVGGRWPDGTSGYHWVPKYRSIDAPWIMERWRPESLTKSQWDRDMVDPVSGWLLLGPYPSRGDYELVWEFDKGVDSDSLDRIVAFVENERGRRSFQDLRDRASGEYEADTREMDAARYGEIREAMTAFGGAPLSYGRHGRGTKTADPVLTAEQVGMPVPKRGGGRQIGALNVSNSLSAGVRF